MQYLKRLNDAEEARYYEILGDHQAGFRRYIVTTPEGRDVCNKPEIMGVRFSSHMLRALTRALRHAPFRSVFEDCPEHNICVLNFLRGGLNFDLRNALEQAFGLNNHCSAFMSSQRYKTGGRWAVREDMYRKLDIPRGAVLVMGDVVATGVTIENGFSVLLEQLGRIRGSVRSVVFFTIGCHKLEKHLAVFDRQLRDMFQDYQGAHAVYLESKLRLVDSKTPLRIGLPGTDLIRLEGLLAPEFEASQYDSVCHPLERCSIYDAGSRAFDTPAYARDVMEYWNQVKELANKGFTLEDALRERWPEPEYLSHEIFLKAKKELWHGVKDSELEALYASCLRRWTPEFEERAATSSAMAEVCDERINTLKNVLGERS